MGLRLGYACVNTQLPSSARTARLANATPERLLELAEANLDALEATLRWNEEHGIEVFRVTSNLIPLASHPVNTVAWWDELDDRFAALGRLLAGSGARLSTHPGQYTVLSSQSESVVAAAVAELDYHDRLLSALRLDRSHRIVLHVGSGAADPDAASRRFAAAFERLSPGAQARLVLENDERWPLDRVLELAAPLGLPVVFDAGGAGRPRGRARGGRDLARRGRPPGGALFDAGAGQAAGRARGDGRPRRVRGVRGGRRRPPARLRARGRGQGAVGTPGARAAQPNP
jgi:UV damage endonuclease UvdE